MPAVRVARDVHACRGRLELRVTCAARDWCATGVREPVLHGGLPDASQCGRELARVRGWVLLLGPELVQGS
eukprot:10202703-Alexandrium_andersonii.AAC.1